LPRLSQHYPKLLTKLKTIDGQKIGEWRAVDGYTVVSGIHPDTGEPYKILVEKPPLVIEFSQIKWPAHWNLPWQPRQAQTGTSATPPDCNIVRRILAYLAGSPAAVSGNGGHVQTLKIATQLVVGFALGVGGAMPYLREYHKRCEPPWNEKELLHKAQEADKNKLGREPGAKIYGESSRESKAGGFGVNAQNFSDSKQADFVSWEQTGINTPNPPPLLSQEAPFPADSILADYHDYVVTQSEGADSYIIGSILPITAALLGRNVWVPWANGALYPNLYVLLVGPPGNMKTTSIDPGENIARGVIDLLDDSPHFHFLSHNYSPESLFDAYFKHPWRLLLCDDANAALTKWQNPHDGDRISSTFLTLFDGKRLSENFRRNRQEGNLETQERWTQPTSTNIVFGVTFNACEFRGNAQRAGLQRRFIPYIAENKARRLHRPRPDEMRLQGLVKQFSLLSHLRGPFAWTRESETLFDQFKDSIDERIRACDILDDRTRGRLTTACAWVLKIAMIFEASRLCYVAKWMPDDPEIIPDSPELILGTEALQLAIDHIEACLKAASSLDQVANRQSIAEQAQILLAYVRTKFRAMARNGAIILTRTQITDSFAHHAYRPGATPVRDIYERFIPYLISVGEAKLVAKEGKKETYAFRCE
jgi:hypothetical protein